MFIHKHWFYFEILMAETLTSHCFEILMAETLNHYLKFLMAETLTSHY